MACILKPECDFFHGYFRCLLPTETMDMEVTVKMLRGYPNIQERPYYPHHILQSLESKTSSLSIPNKKNENLPGIRRQTW